MKWRMVWGLLLAIGLVALTMGVFSARAAISSPASGTLTPVAFLPFVVRSDSCPGNVIANGGFESGDTGWYTSTNGFGWKLHSLIGSDAEGFHPYAGHYAARLGGYEGVLDVLTQTVTIPANGQLSFWWWMKSYETLPYHDWFSAALLSPEGTLVLALAVHDDQDVQEQWQQDVIDVSAYAGQTLILRLAAYNDNYYHTRFDLDEVCLCSTANETTDYR